MSSACQQQQHGVNKQQYRDVAWRVAHFNRSNAGINDNNQAVRFVALNERKRITRPLLR